MKKAVKQISACCFSILAVSSVFGGAVYQQNSASESSLVYAVGETVSAEPRAVFTDVSAQAGQPVHIALENVTASEISYQWTVGEEKISCPLRLKFLPLCLKKAVPHSIPFRFA